jgi:hypothetical protein
MPGGRRRVCLEPAPGSRYNPPVNSTLVRVIRLAIGLGALAALAACGRSIGDECQISTDCSATGDRSCDLSQPGGYCTIEGCDDHSCPDDSVCVRFFPIDFLTEGCDLAGGSASTADMMCGVDASSVCLPCDPTLDGTTCGRVPPPATSAAQPGLCAPRSTEHRLCVKSCDNDGDCRDGYQCRQGKTHGSIPLLSNPNGTVKFCVPKPS